MENSHHSPRQGRGDVDVGGPSSSVTTSSASTKGRARGVTLDQRGRPMMGRVARILHGQGHGFIRAKDSRLLYFHRHDVATGLFNALAVHDRVAFEVIEDALVGPRAVRVNRTAAKARSPERSGA